MWTKTMDYRFTLVLAFAASAFAVPTGRTSKDSAVTTCSKSCTASSKFTYTPGMTYRYKYEGETRTSMLGASEDHSTIGINALVDIEVVSKCEMIMQVHDVSIFAYDSKNFNDQDKDGIFAQTLSKYPLRFSFQDGQIDSICPNGQEKHWATNIKRGILSSFQNSMNTFDLDFKGSENDVTGKCLTEYKVAQRGWKTVSIKKSKDVSSCSHRQGFDSAVQTTPFRLSSGMKSLPIMKSTHTCDHEISMSGYLSSSKCHEMHLLRPFSKENSGATTEVTQSMTFVFTEAGTSNNGAECGPAEKMYFEHAPSDVETDLSARDAIKVLQEMCDDTGVTPMTSRQFSGLVSTMKRIDFKGLRRVYNQVLLDRFCRGTNERVRKFYIDAIPMVGTESSIELMKTLVSNGDIIGTQADLWIASMAFVDHPTEQMIKYVQELIGLPSLSTKVLLPLSAMVQSYCRINPLCGEVTEIADFIKILTTNLDGGCKANEKNFRNIMMSLRALGNLGIAESAVPALHNCISESDNSMDIRVAAIQAFRKMSCAADRNNLMGILRDATADSEIRIVSYLAVIQCPSDYYISQILETLETEEVNQVGSFVWSHLSNLMESSDPDNKDVQGMLNDVILDEKFNLERFKYSRNYEGSFFLEKYNTGAKVDSNIIWSTKSFVPRMATLNLTTSLFGESMNLFEVGGRVEGLDRLLESYFGPVGYYNDDNKGSNDIPEADPQLARLSRRKFSDLKKNAKTPMDELRGAIYMRMFGNEISYNMFGANNGVSDSISDYDLYNFLQKLRNNEQQDIALTKNIMFLDSSYTLPTVVGLPLKLAINGTASVSLNVGGQVDIKNPKSRVVIEGNFEPSGSVEVNSMMSVDAMVTKGGLKMVSTLYTSTGAHGRIELMDGNIFDLKFDITKEKSDILDVKSSFFIVYDDFEKEQKMKKNGRNEETMCTGDRLKGALGVQFCASYSSPNDTAQSDAPYFPFSGPLSFSVGMHKLDIPNGYQMQVKTIKNDIMTLFRFKSDTPGSSENRAIGLDVQVTHIDKKLEVILTSPWKKANFNGKLTDTSTIKGLNGQLDIDNTDKVYTFDAKILIEQIKNRVTYTPTINVDIADWKSLNLSGVLNYVREESLDADLTINGATEEPIIIQGSILNTDIMVGVKGKFNYQTGEGYVLEALSKRIIEKKKLRSRYTFEPRLYVRTPTDELVEFNGKAALITGKSFKADGSLTKITKIPFTVNVDMSMMEIAKKKRVKGTAKVNVVGPKLSSKMTIIYDNRAGKNINLRTRWDYNFAKTYRDIIFTNTKVKTNIYKTKKIVKVTSTLNSDKNNKLDAALSINYQKAKVATKLDASLKYGEGMKQKTSKDTVQLNMVAKHPSEESVEYTVNLNHPASDVNVEIQGENKYKDKSVQSKIQVQYHKDRVVVFDVHLHNKSDLYPNYAGALSIKLPKDREVSFAGGFGKENDNKYVSNLEFEIIKGRRTKIDTVFKIATDKVYEFEVGVQVPELDPVRILGAYIREETSHAVEASYKKGDKLYRVYGERIYEESKTAKFIFDVTVPSRRVKILTGSSKMDTERHMLVDIQWNAEKNLDDRFLTNITYDFKSWNDFEVASNLYYPTRKIEFNMKHSAAARYLTKVDLSWSPKEKIEFDIIFRDDKFNEADRTELTVEFLSPFEGYEELGLAVSLIRDSAQYQTKSSVTWGKKKKILVSSTAKVPLNIKSVDIVGTITTPFDDYKSMTAQVKHRLNNALSSEVVIQWGRNTLSLTTTGELQYTDLSRTFSGVLDLRTPFDELRVFVIKANHSDDYRQYKSLLSVETTEESKLKTAVQYVVELDVMHDNTIAGFSNKGKVNVVIPEDVVLTHWELSSWAGKNRAMLSVEPKRGNTFKVDFNENHRVIPNRKFASSFELLIPTEAIQKMLITFKHEDKPGFVETAFMVSKDNAEFTLANFNYQNKYNSLKVNALMKSMYTEDLVVKLISAHSIMPYNGYFEMRWGDTPYKVVADSSFYYNDFGLMDNSLKVSTPIPGMSSISIIAKREKIGLDWQTESTVTVDGRKVSVKTTYRIDHVKLTTVTIKTSFPQFPGLTTSFRVEGIPTNFNGDASFEMKPYVNKISTDFNLAYYMGTSLSGALNLNTPFRQYPYMKMKFDSNKMGISRVSNFEIEYLPTQIFKLKSNYRFTSLETLEGTVSITSPYTENQEVITAFTHIGNKEEFKTKAEIKCDCFKKPVYAVSTFKSTDGIESTFEMDSPFRGYETVKWNFSHYGTVKDFHTKAEYETNGKKISFENLFSMKDSVKYQITFLTPFANITRTHLLLSHSGSFPNTDTRSEIAYNENVIESDFALKHNKRRTEANVVVSTPFKRYEDITMTISKSGSLKDLKAEADLVFDQHWHGSLQHKMEGWKIATVATLKSPLLIHDAKLTFNQTGEPMDFESNMVYTLGPEYTTTSKTKFFYDLPNLMASTKTVTEIDGEVRVNALSAENNVDYKSWMDFDITTKVSGQMRENKANSDFVLKCHWVDEPRKSILFNWITNIPHEIYNHIELDYELDITNEGKGNVIGRHRALVDIPRLEKFKFDYNATGGKDLMKVQHKYSYGEWKFTSKEIWQPGSYQYETTSPFEGYESFILDVKYSEQMLGRGGRNTPDKLDWFVDATMTTSVLEEPVEILVRGDEYRSVYYPTSVSIAYPDNKVISVDFDFDDSESNLKIVTPYSPYDSFDFSAQYTLNIYENDILLSASSSALDKPVKLTTHYEIDASRYVYKVLLDFTSEFNGYTHYKLDSETSRKNPYLVLTWEDEDGKEKKIDINGPVVLYNADKDGVQTSLSISIATPFQPMKDFKFKCEHRHFTSPLRAKEAIILQYNEVKYLDLNSEFGALNKFSGIISIHEPQQMEFSLTGTNDGESVDADLVLNWNKLDKDSSFRLQFGLADSGYRTEVKKVLFVRIVNPGRIISIHNNFTQSPSNIQSSGRISWDELDNQEMTYDLYFGPGVKSSTYQTNLKVSVPVRSIEVSSSFTDDKSKLSASGSLLWDAKNDRNKQVNLKLLFDPTNTKKLATVELVLPSLNKELSMSNELRVNDGIYLFDGETKLTYSPDTNKAVILKYTIQDETVDKSSDEQSYSAGWSIKHDYTKTHLMMSSDVTVSKTTSTGNLQLKYRSANKDLTALNAKSVLDLNERSFIIEIDGSDESATLKGEMTSLTPYTVSVTTSRNRKPTWNTIWTVDTDRKTLDASMTYDNMNGQVVTQALFPNASSFISKTSTNNGVSEGMITATLVDRKLHGHIKWRPEIIAESTQHVSNVIQQAAIELSPVMEKCMKGLGEEMVKKHSLIRESIQEEFSPITDDFKQEMASVEQDLRKMRRELKKMYRENALYMKSIEEYSDGAIKSMLSGYSTAINKLSTAYSKAQEKMEELSNKIDGYQFKENYNKMMETVTVKVKEMEATMIRELMSLFDLMEEKLNEFSDVYDETITEISVHFQKMMEVLLEELALTPYLDDVQTALNNLAGSGIDQTELKKLLDEVKEVFVKVAEKSNLMDKAMTTYKMTDKLIKEQFGDIISNEQLQRVGQTLSDLHEQVSWLYKYTEMDISLREVVQKLQDYLRKKVMEEFKQLPLGLLDLHKSKMTTFDLENGEIEFDLYLPIPVENFDEIMKISIKKNIGILKQKIAKYFPRSDICLWDLYYSLPPVKWALRDDVVPPFDVYGIVSGKQHFTTFDGLHYDVSGLCSYVLAHDMSDGNFTVALKYQGGPRNLQKESIIVMVAGQTVEMFQDYMVKVNGKPAELPYQSYKLAIRRSGNSVTLTSKMGLTVVSDFNKDYHIVALSGWYFGKVGGLLGSYDNEKYNDLMKSDGEVTDNVRKLANSWQVDRGCRSTMVYMDKEPSVKSPECEAVFNVSSSSLRPCFLRVNPESYQHSCNMEPAGLCDVATLYVQTCARHGVNLNLPSSCVKCPSHNDNEVFTPEQTLRYEDGTDTPVRNVMDVVFVVEDGQCNKDISSKLKDVVYQLEQSLSKSGISDNRYGLVGYSGRLYDSHTMEGQLFNEATKFSMGLENIHFRNIAPYTYPLSALKYASSLPYRTGVKKIMVLVSCTPCDETNGYSYSTLSKEFKQKDITLHVFRQNGFQLTKNRSPNLHIYGIDNKERYLQRDSKLALSDIVTPQDYCASLALDSDGSIFDSGYMMEDQVRQQRQFMDQFSERIQKKSSSCQVCNCEIDGYGEPQTVCRTCDSRPVTFKPIGDVMKKVGDFKNAMSSYIGYLF